MPRITLEPRKTTRVPFLTGKAKMKTEHKLHISYYGEDVLQSMDRSAQIRYTFTGLTSGKPIPGSQLIIKEKGLPQTIARAEPSAIPDKFHSIWVEDPLVEISDRVAKVEQTKFEEKKLSNRLIERVREEAVTRNIRVQNKTGKAVHIRLEIEDSPANGLVFKNAEPAPNASRPPEQIWELNIAKEADVSVSMKLNLKRTERIELPSDRTLRAVMSPSAAMPMEYAQKNDDLDEQEFEDEKDQDDNNPPPQANQQAFQQQTKG
jgi:hypothetical protein